MRHSASHVMAEAVQTLFPGVKFGIGPAIENGFYYDFDLPRPLTPEDLPVIESKMKEIIKQGLAFYQREYIQGRSQEDFRETSLINWNLSKN